MNSTMEQQYMVRVRVRHSRTAMVELPTPLHLQTANANNLYTCNDKEHKPAIID